MLKRFDFDPANVSLTRFADDGALVEDTAITLAATTTPDGLAHRVSIDPSGDIDTIEFILVGTDADDNAITETMVGSTTSTIESVKYFKTLTSVTPDTSDAATVDIGFVDEFVSPTILLNWRKHVPSNWQLDVTGTISIDTDWTLSDPAAARFTEQSALKWLDGSGVETALDAETADSAKAVVIPAGYVAMRFRVNSYTDTAEFQAYVTQAEIV